MKANLNILIFFLIFNINLSFGQTSLNYFNANQVASNIELNWQSDTEMNIDFYSIERSIDSINYSLIQNITGSGSSPTQLNYSYTDISSFTDNCYYYRLKANHFNGFYQYLDTVKICYNSLSTSISDLKVNLFYNVYPIPITNGLLNIELSEHEHCTLNIINQVGQVTLTLNNIKKKTSINCDKLKKGLYYLQLVKNNGQTSIEKFIVE